MKDKTRHYEHIKKEITVDGHPSLSPDKLKIVTDTYPNRQRTASIYLIENSEIKTIARVFAPFKYEDDFRCDLHPRWSRLGDKICFDSVYSGKRSLYVVKIKLNKKDKEEKNGN